MGHPLFNPELMSIAVSRAMYASNLLFCLAKCVLGGGVPLLGLTTICFFVNTTTSGDYGFKAPEFTNNKPSGLIAGKPPLPHNNNN